MALLKAKKTGKKKSPKTAPKSPKAAPTVDLDQLAKANETTANITNYQSYLRNRMKGVKLA